ncbi:MAG: fused DSP-PTPase phosphatase/NAD kinase-like protein [Pyrinomonadaceae bacterium]
MITRKPNFVSASILFLLFGFASYAQTDAVSKDLPNFHKVNDRLYRGGQPKDAGFAELKKMGVVTVIDLRDDDENALEEKAMVEKAGMKFINFPLPNWSRPKLEHINKILAAINANENQPVFVHCKRGKDRTGTVIAIYRITHDDRTAKRAGDEAEKYGIGWWQFKMRDFINDYYRDHVKKK